MALLDELPEATLEEVRDFAEFLKSKRQDYRDLLLNVPDPQFLRINLGRMREFAPETGDLWEALAGSCQGGSLDLRCRVFDTRQRVFDTRRRVFDTRQRVFNTRQRVLDTRQVPAPRFLRINLGRMREVLPGTGDLWENCISSDQPKRILLSNDRSYPLGVC